MEGFDGLQDVCPGVEPLPVAPAIHLVPLDDAASDQLELLRHPILVHHLDQLLLVLDPVLLQQGNRSFFILY